MVTSGTATPKRSRDLQKALVAGDPDVTGILRRNLNLRPLLKPRLYASTIASLLVPGRPNAPLEEHRAKERRREEEQARRMHSAALVVQ